MKIYQKYAGRVIQLEFAKELQNHTNKIDKISSQYMKEGESWTKALWLWRNKAILCASNLCVILSFAHELSIKDYTKCIYT